MNRPATYIPFRRPEGHVGLFAAAFHLHLDQTHLSAALRVPAVVCRPLCLILDPNGYAHGGRIFLGVCSQCLPHTLAPYEIRSYNVHYFRITLKRESGCINWDLIEREKSEFL